jgi:diaminopimelate decarboxylase
MANNMDDLTFKKAIDSNHQNLETPCYVFNSNTLINNYQNLKKNLDTPLIVSIKANPNAELLNRVSHITKDGYEVASLKELSLIAGPTADPKYLNNPSMDINLIKAAVGAKANIIIDHAHLVEILASLENRRRIKPLIIRLNSSVLKEIKADFPPVIDDHFGLDLSSLHETVARIHQYGFKVSGFHVFNGSNSFKEAAFATLDATFHLIPILEKILGYPVSFINLGGGFSSNWELLGFDFSRYRTQLHKIPDRIHVVHETGRGIFASAGKFLTRILYTKKINNHIIAICDGGLVQNFLLCKTENVIKKYQQPSIWKLPTNKSMRSDLPIKYVGTTCSQNDVISKCPAGSMLPETGDICIFENCGAYNSTYTVSNFLGLKNFTTYIW